MNQPASLGHSDKRLRCAVPSRAAGLERDDEYDPRSEEQVELADRLGSFKRSALEVTVRQ